MPPWQLRSKCFTEAVSLEVLRPALATALSDMRMVLQTGKEPTALVRAARDRMVTKDHCFYRHLTLYPGGMAFLASIDSALAAQSLEESLTESLTFLARDVPTGPCPKDPEVATNVSHCPSPPDGDAT